MTCSSIAGSPQNVNISCILADATFRRGALLALKLSYTDWTKLTQTGQVWQGVNQWSVITFPWSMAVQGVISSFSSSISSSSLFRLFFCRSWIRWNNFLGVSRWVSFTNQSSPKVFVPRKWPQTSVQFFLLSFLWRNYSEVFLWYKKKKAGEAVAGAPLPLFASCFFCNLRASAAFLQNLQLLCWVKFSRMNPKCLLMLE